MRDIIYIAGGCLWGVQEFFRHIPGVLDTKAGRANGTSSSTQSAYDGYAECVKIIFDPNYLCVEKLIDYLFEIIDPYSINQQGNDIGKKYRTGIYSESNLHLKRASQYILALELELKKQNKTNQKIAVEVLPLINFILSDREHQDRLTLHPEDHSLCHIPLSTLHKYKS